MKLIKFESKYRDDLIFMILEAKNALGRVPGLNEDLLDIQKNYFDKGDMFWIALDDDDRVIGSVGYSSVENCDDVVLHRLFVKANLKHQGIGTALLKTLRASIKQPVIFRCTSRLAYQRQARLTIATGINITSNVATLCRTTI